MLLLLTMNTLGCLQQSIATKISKHFPESKCSVCVSVLFVGCHWYKLFKYSVYIYICRYSSEIETVGINAQNLKNSICHSSCEMWIVRKTKPNDMEKNRRNVE